jgi:hypothetical protein
MSKRAEVIEKLQQSEALAKLRDEMVRLADAANDDKPGARDKLEALLLRESGLLAFVDLNRGTLERVIGAWIAGAGNIEITMASAKQKRNQMGYADAGPVERLLIDRIVMCWLGLLHAEDYNAKCCQAGVTFKEADLAERHLSRANNRFLRAVEALQRYRVLIQAERMAKAKAGLLEAKAGEARLNKANGALRLLKQSTG